ncbi:kynureninase [Fictibacillus nanhaiensis]|uniref:kynureninase n=1 Tax=Fictibacillus nanhaiensis TaxID=742169 RepID=UPI001C961C9E|nr:kynureninase [Fictibacillus nanhaiensis]MBY6035014.1 kynureninase [Fictibacillus nanhaiensis]
MKQITEKTIELLDQNDELASFKNEFYVKNDSIYLDGNSLGLLSKRAEQSLLDVLNDWKEQGIDGWMGGKYPWFTLSEQLAEKLSPLVGAESKEVIVTGSTTTNLHQLVATFFEPQPGKTKILADELTFPSDIYALQSQLKLRGLDPATDLIQVKSKDGMTLEEDDIIEAMTDDVALIVLPSVLYRSGQLLDMERLTKEAHKRNIPIGLDLCHSIGAVPHDLSHWGVDFAFWCNYKYVNAGPGGVGGIYVNKKHFQKTPGLSGWFGSKKESQFDMDHTFDAEESAGGFQIGTPHMLSTAPLIGSLSIFEEATIEKVRRKSLNLTALLMDLLNQELNGEFQIVNPLEDRRRGGHIALKHNDAARICKALKDNGIVPDFRAPNVIRLAPAALYNSFRDVYDAVEILTKIMKTREYEKYENKREVIA